MRGGCFWSRLLPIWIGLCLWGEPVKVLGAPQSSCSTSTADNPGDTSAVTPGSPRAVTERDVLLQFHDFFPDFAKIMAARGASSISWTNQSFPCKLPRWKGVTCSQGAVVGINMGCPTKDCGPDVNLQGPFPEFLSSLHALQTLNLTSNNITGTLPASWGDPSLLSNFNYLEVDACSITGSLPEEWGTAGALPSLATIILRNNTITGTLPAAWGTPGALQSLSLLKLNYNYQLSGTLPMAWSQPGSFPSLETLFLRDTRIGGTLPEDWGANDTLPLLTAMMFDNLYFTGSLPPSWGDNFRYAQIIQLTGNIDMNTALPGAWAKMEELGMLTLAFINMNGTEIPPEWLEPGVFPKLTLLDLHKTNLGGKLPESWSKWPLIETLLLPDNYFSGTLPASWGDNDSFPSLQVLDVSINSLTGTLPASWGAGTSFPRLKKLGVALQDIRGTVPPEWDVNFRNLSGNRPLTELYLQPQVPEQEKNVVNFCLEKPMDIPLCNYTYDTQTYQNIWDSTACTAPRNTIPSCNPPAVTATGVVIGAVIGVALAVAVGTIVLAYFMQRDVGETLWQFLLREKRRGRKMVLTRVDVERGNSMGNVYDWTIREGDLEYATGPDGQDALLGQGAYGKVYQAMWKGGMDVAVKVVTKENVGETMDMGEMVKEIEILQACKSPFIVQFLGASLSPDKIMIVTELMTGGSLFKLLGRRQVTWIYRGSNVALEVAQGLHYLHENNVIHLDVKSANVLLTQHGQAKLADVGLAHIKATATRGSLLPGELGTFAYMAPEVMMRIPVKLSADVFSFGVLLWEICSGEVPTRVNRRTLRVPEECPQDIVGIIEQCTQGEPGARPTMKDLIGQLRVAHHTALRARMGPRPANPRAPAANGQAPAAAV